MGSIRAIFKSSAFIIPRIFKARMHQSSQSGRPVILSFLNQNRETKRIDKISFTTERYGENLSIGLLGVNIPAFAQNPSFRCSFLTKLSSWSAQRTFSTSSVYTARGLHENPRNEKIRAKTVVLIDEDGNKLATIPLRKALDTAKEKQLELVEIQKQMGTRSAICKLYSRKMIYELEKKHKHNQHGSKMKELTITGRIAPQDLQWKTKKIYNFLENGYSVKMSITRKPYHKISDEEKLEIVRKVVEEVKEVGILEGQPKSVGFLVLNCTFKPVLQHGKRS